MTTTVSPIDRTITMVSGLNQVFKRWYPSPPRPVLDDGEQVIRESSAELVKWYGFSVGRAILTNRRFLWISTPSIFSIDRRLSVKTYLSDIAQVDVGRYLARKSLRLTLKNGRINSFTVVGLDKWVATLREIVAHRKQP